MRVVLDTNILLSALIVRGTPPDQLYLAWRAGRFDLVSTERQLDELNQVSRRPFFRARMRPAEAGRMVNDVRRLAVMCDSLPAVDASPDPDDNYLLAVAIVAGAHYIVTGDKSDLLALKRYRGTSIVTARTMVELLGMGKES